MTSSKELDFSEDIYRIISKVDEQLRGTVDHDQGIMFTGVHVVGSIEDGVEVRSMPIPSGSRKRTMERDPE